MRLSTLDKKSRETECSAIGYCLMPLYFDADVDEPASVHSKVVSDQQSLYLKEGMYRLPILMRKPNDKIDLSFALL